MKRSLSALALLTALIGAAWSQTAQEIIDRMRDQNTQPSMQARIAALIEESGRAPSERLIDQYSVTENGLTKAVVVFQSPASVRNTRFLMVENTGRDEDRWIFLPSLNRVRRLAASEGNSSFIGEITYDDLSVGGGDRTHTLLREETLGGEACWVIESRPVTPGEGTYSRSVTWVIKDKYLPLRVEMYDRQNRLLKTAEALEIKQQQNVWSIMKLKMSNVQNGNATTLTFQILEYGRSIPAGVFTTRFLETGRP